MAGRHFIRRESMINADGGYSGDFTPLKRIEDIGEGDVTPKASQFPYQGPFRPSSGNVLRINTARGQASTPSIDTPTTDDGNDHGGVSLTGMATAHEESKQSETARDNAIAASCEVPGVVGQGVRHGLGSSVGTIDAIVSATTSGPFSNIQFPPNPHTYSGPQNHYGKDARNGGQSRSHTPAAGEQYDRRGFSRQSNRNKHSAYVDQKRSGTSRGQQRIFSRSAHGIFDDGYGAPIGRTTPGVFNAQTSYGVQSGPHAQGGFNHQASTSFLPIAPLSMSAQHGYNEERSSVMRPAGLDGQGNSFPDSVNFAVPPNSNFAAHGGFATGQSDPHGGHNGFNAVPGGFEGVGRSHTAVPWDQGTVTMLHTQQDHGMQTGLGLYMSNANTMQQGAHPRTTSYVGSDSSGHDSVQDQTRTAHSGRARELARMIMSGECDPGEEYDYGKKTIYGPMTYYGSKKTGEISPTKYHAARKTQLHGEQERMALAIQRDKDTRGSAAAFISVEVRSNPDWLYQVQLGFKPTADQFFNALPITEPCRHVAPSSAGVVRLMGFPYDAPRAEVAAFLCRQAKILPQPLGSPYFAVHVIMERSTGKTNDAFIELASEAEAIRVVGQSEKRTMNGRPQKMGDRTVEVVMSSQEDLMHELFGRAKKIVWMGNTPVVSAHVECYRPGIPAEGFDGFVGTEELHEMLQRCEHPQRYFHITRHQPRLFEHWITTLVKYPWHAIECVSIAECDRLFEATMRIVAALINALQYAAKGTYDNNRPTFGTLRELTVTVLTCPGFSEAQKAAYVQFMFQKDLATVCDPKGTNLKFGGVRAISPCWPFKVLAIDPAAPKEMVEYFMYLVREATQGHGTDLSLAERHRRRMSAPVSGPFGKITIDYKNAKTIEEVGELELDFVEVLLHRVLDN